ncbi:MAG TPA: efflux RND transporter periplasmic adaptor subunit, partial [Chloroflexota bacterium]
DSAQAGYKQLADGPTDEEMRMANAAVAQAEGALSLARSPYRQSDFDAARAGVAQAAAAVDAAQLGLSETRVVSPIDGVVSDRSASLGQLVGPSGALLQLVSGGVEIAIGVEEAQVGLISEGQKAEIAVAAYPGEAIPARVASISPTADPKSRTFTVKVRPTTDDGRLRSGMFAQVRIVTAEKASAVLAPKEALITKGGTTSVFVLKGDTVEARPVKTGIASGAQVEIVSGLSAGEEVVTGGQADLHDGDKVKKS